MIQNSSSLIGFITYSTIIAIAYTICKVSKPASKFAVFVWLAFIAIITGLCWVLLWEYGEKSIITVFTMISTGIIGATFALVGQKRLTTELGKGFWEIYNSLPSSEKAIIRFLWIFIRIILIVIIGFGGFYLMYIKYNYK